MCSMSVGWYIGWADGRTGSPSKSDRNWHRKNAILQQGHITCTFNNCDLPPILFVLSAVCVPIFFFRFSVFPFQVHSY